MASGDPTLDPNSSKFCVKRWARVLFHVVSRDPDKYPQRTAGVSYRNLSVHGFGSTTDYQKDVLNVLFRGPSIIRKWMGRGQRKIQILRDFDGLVKSGEMLVVLGRPGSGVSTLLKTIAGQTYGFYVDTKSEFNYQGISWDMMHNHFRGEVIYQAETDIHFPQLTVGQTLLFAALARTPKNRMPGVTRKRYAEHLKDVIMAVLGLSHTANTKLGNEYIRGVSGGERKRVSIAEVTLSQSPLQCWDNSTRGLDSAAALEFVKTLRLSTDVAGTAAIVAIYQASQQAYETFDKVALLYEGRQIYFGHKDAAKKYFTDLGFHCADRQTTADFLTSLTNPAERIIQPGFENKVPRTPDEFADVWKNSDARKHLLMDIAAFEDEFQIGGPYLEKFKASRKAQQASLMSVKSPYTISVAMQVYLCMTRGFQRLQGDKTYFLITVFGNLVISLVLGSVFYNLPPTTASFNRKCILLFFAVLFNALNSALEILSLYAQRPIVEKHATYALYHPFSEAISSMVCDLPSKIISTFAFNVPLYFMSNLRRETGPFFIFLLFAFTCTLTMSMIFRTIGQSSRTIPQALTPATIFILALVIYTGFILPTGSMHHWLRWINYINPIAYAYESLVANEFHNRHFPCAQFVPSGPTYQTATGSGRTCSVPGASPGSEFASGDIYINATFGFYHSHIWRNFGILLGYIIVFMIAYLLASEMIPASRSKGEVLVFRRGYKPVSTVRSTDDEESAAANVVGRNNTTGESPTDVRKQNPMGIQRQTAIFHWRDVCYDISIKGKPRRILDQVDGWVKPGTLTALMGASGAGKTSLLNVLASRITTGVVTGDIFVNDRRRDKSFQRKTGYVQQQDLHLETSTVREALRFSAMLRQPASSTMKEKLDYVEEVIRLLDMEAYSDAVVGVLGEGLNVEQRKRLTIGVELAAKPDLLLFLDEPTSGLDSQTSWAITTLIRKLSNNGQAILCTIHQPSAMLFQQFDRLLLLSKGGKTAYFGDIGENSEVLTSYFEKYGAQPCARDENPAEWMLKVIGAAPGAHTERDWSDTWRNSSEFVEVKRELIGMEQQQYSPPESRNDGALTTQYASSFRYQLSVCTKRVFEQYWRTPSYIYSKLILCGGTSLFIGVSFYNAEISIQGLQNQMFSIFMLIVIFAFLVYQAMPNFIVQRDLYEARERPSKTYAWYTFVLANIIVDLPWNSLAAMLIFFPFYYLIGMYRNAIPTHAVPERGGLMFLLIWCFMLFASTFTNMVIAGVASAEIGAIISLLLFTFSLIFCGVLATPAALPGFWIFMYRVSPFTYLVSALLSTGLANNIVQCADLEVLRIEPPSGQTCGEYMAAYMNMAGGAVYNPAATENCEFCPLVDTNVFLTSVYSFYSQRWRNFGIMWAFIIFNAFAAVFLYWLARVPKRRKEKSM
ncbi:hypothetical protein K432DRAFT_413340 [Lepidopterella palustris CBS 459.81]|uniref:ABC transporter domain-containing protein n=1 Tax=Lepidopterella palustris CBS 459.81 TaxID=1314670 RepID=A0A8E2EJV8_9PEZI|nr:hypothetical protein K432DRAFT_413340 [Lepidopterella palustris CBS 459.81]